MTFSLVIWTVAFLSALCAAEPTISFPINSQVPPVARIGQPFSFVFSSSTFSSTEPLTYSLVDAPAWLSIDSESRRIYGTPTEADIASGEDIVGVNFALVADDGSGSASLNAVLVISRNPSPTVAVPLSKQTPGFGSFSQPSSIVMDSDTPFALDFAADTFSHPAGSGLSYYAVMADNTPLPSWVSFNPTDLAFSGTTPTLDALVQIPQSFSFQLIASDVVGFSAASLPFSIVVGNHRIAADNSFIVLNATAGVPLSYTELHSDVRFDGHDVESGNVSITSTPGIPSWLAVDKTTWDISGTPPATAESSNFTIILQDNFSNTLNLTVLLNMTNGLFKGSLPEMTIIAGKKFQFDLTPHLSNPSDIETQIDVTPRLTWIQFDSDKETIFGDAPERLTVSSITIRVTAKSKSSGLELSQDLPVRLQAANEVSATASGSTPTSSSSTTAVPGSDARQKPSSKVVLMATLIPTLILLLIFACIMICWAQRRRARANGRSTSQPPIRSFMTGITTRIKGSFEALRRMHDKRCSSTTRKSRQKSYAEAAIGSIKDFQPDADTSAILDSSTSDDTLSSRNKSWFAVMVGKLFRKRQRNTYASHVGLNEDEKRGMREATSHVEPGNDSSSLSSGDTFRAGMVTPESSTATTPDFIHCREQHPRSNSEAWESYRTTEFDEFTTVASSTGTSILQLATPLQTHTPTPTAKSPATGAWAVGNMSRFIDRFRRQKEAEGNMPESGLPPQIAPPRPPRLPQPTSADRPVTRRGPTSTGQLSDPLRNQAEEASLPNGGPGIAMASRGDTLMASRNTAQNQFSGDSLAMPSHNVPARLPIAHSRTWSTVYSSIRDDTELQDRDSRRSMGGRSRRTSLPPDRWSRGSSQPNWTTIRESPTPSSVWRDDVSVLTDNRWLQRPRTACETLGEEVEESGSSSPLPPSPSPSPFGRRRMSRQRGWSSTAGSRHSRRSSRLVGLGTYGGMSSLGSGQGQRGLGRDRTLGSSTTATGSEDDYAVFI